MDFYNGYNYASNILYPRSKPDDDTRYGNVLLFKNENFVDDNNIEDAYLDRMKSWEPEKYKKASDAIGKTLLYRVNGKTKEDVEKFLTVYNGYKCKLIEASENMGYDGYYYTYLKWTKR